MKALVWADKKLELLEKFSSYLAAILLGVILIGIVYGAFGRAFFDRPPVWTGSVTAYALLLSTLFAAPKLLRDNQHVVVDALLRAVPIRVRKILVFCALLITMLSCAVMVYASAVVTVQAIEEDFKDMREISIHFAVLSGPIFFCFLLMTLESLRQAALMMSSSKQ